MSRRMGDSADKVNKSQRKENGGGNVTNPQVKRVLVSVTDKTGVVEFARALHEEFGAEIISTGRHREGDCRGGR